MEKMEKFNNSENLQQTKNDFKVWLKKYHEQLIIKNQSLKSCLVSKQQINEELKNNIEKLLNNSVNTSCVAVDVIPNRVQTQLAADVNHLKMKSEQLHKCNDAINEKVEEETKKMRNKFYEMISKDEVALKPYHEVEELIKDLILKTDNCKMEQLKNEETFVKTLKEREHYFKEIQQSILMMEPIEQVMRLSLQNCNKNFVAKLKSLKLNFFEEASNESSEAKELLADISNLKSQLYSP